MVKVLKRATAIGKCQLAGKICWTNACLYQAVTFTAAFAGLEKIAAPAHKG